jgi:four helix bundle protein
VLAAYDLLRELHPAIRGLPKSQQFLLGQRIQESALDLLMALVAANRRRRKRPLLEEADVELEKLRFLLRLANDLQFMSEKRYLAFAEQLTELGRMLGGWLRWSRSPEDADAASRVPVR